MQSPRETGLSNRAVVIVASLVVIGVLVYLLTLRSPSATSTSPGGSILVFCAAGMRGPVDAIAAGYEREYGVHVDLQYAGSNTLLSNIELARRGDLYLAADDSYIDIARGKGLVAEAIPIASMRPVLVVKESNPKNITGLRDLLRDDVQISLANPDAAAIGQATRNLLRAEGIWEDVAKRTRVFKTTVNEVANDVLLPAIDAGVVWDAIANQYGGLESIRVEAFDRAQRSVAIGVLTYSKDPARALRFARYMGARDRGLPVFENHGFTPVDGDIWEKVPEIVLFSGGVNRVAIEETVRDFERREGVRITTVYNGCGILTGQMRAIAKGQVKDVFPDGYLSCDTSFMTSVQDLFGPSINVSETDMVILVQADNPHEITTVADLARPGLNVGLAHPQKSALGKLTKDLLTEMGLYDAIEPNIRTEKPTADFLVTDMQAGGLDAAIVYRANTSRAGERLRILEIDHPAAKATQPYATSLQSDHKHTMGRLLAAIRSSQSERRFNEVGFRFLAGRRN